jgi:hypothetical protein
MKAKPILHLSPHLNSELELEEKMGGGFLNLIAKLTPSTILPSSFLKSICRPNSILNDHQAKVLHFGGAHSFQTKDGNGILYAPRIALCKPSLTNSAHHL